MTEWLGSLVVYIYEDLCLGPHCSPGHSCFRGWRQDDHGGLLATRLAEKMPRQGSCGRPCLQRRNRKKNVEETQCPSLASLCIHTLYTHICHIQLPIKQFMCFIPQRWAKYRKAYIFKFIIDSWALCLVLVSTVWLCSQFARIVLTRFTRGLSIVRFFIKSSDSFYIFYFSSQYHFIIFKYFSN